MAGTGSSMAYSLLLFTVILSLQEVYRGKLASSELFTILGGFTSSLLFLVLLTFIGNFQESCGMKTGWGAVILAEIVALIAAGTVHRVCITTWIAEKIDLEIKQWVAGKEGNMRALLSSLQNVLWRECGWEEVSLTDLITSTSVKKAHRKAALCVHPDKVQQKGETIEQKYTAEKVFDILQEAWKKFEADELR